jgi:hypothetical protein
MVFLSSFKERLSDEGGLTDPELSSNIKLSLLCRKNENEIGS